MPELARRQYDRDLYRVNHYGSNYNVNSNYGYNKRNSQNNAESVHVIKATQKELQIRKKLHATTLSTKSFLLLLFQLSV